MHGGVARGEHGAPGVTRRVVRLLVLLGVGVAAYLVLSLFDHAARADVGSIDQPIDRIGATSPVATVKAVAAGARRAVPPPKSLLPKLTAPKTHPQKTHPQKTHPQKTHRSTIRMPAVHPPKVQAQKIHPR